LYLDLDDFKIINATKGRNAGDEILRTVATRLTECARHGDTAARAGSDEFAVICENIADQEEVSLLAQRIGRVLAAPIAIGEEQFNTSVSIGISMGRRAGTADQLLRDADLAMHRAKQRGRNAIEMFDEALRWHAMDRFELERDLRRGLQEREIVPYYQPIMELRSGRLSGFEALARWRHPRRGLLRPAQFLSIAEDAQLIGALGAAMLEAACKQLAQWRLTRADLTMAVNLSLRQLDGTYRRHLAEKIEECGIPPEAIHLEVTESVLLDMQSSAAANLNALASMGLCLGIDDFGTGYSSMVYLKRFPVRFLKIDRSFVDGLPDQSEDSAIVDAIIRLGQSLDIATIAEGVETAEQLDALRRLGCRFAQGYYIAPPRAAEECALD
jgi:diguanylate cyclase (GGDEF)-like protein